MYGGLMHCTTEVNREGTKRRKRTDGQKNVVRREKPSVTKTWKEGDACAIDEVDEQAGRAQTVLSILAGIAL